MPSSLGGHEQKTYKHRRTARFFQLPENDPLQAPFPRRRSNSFPSSLPVLSPPPPPPKLRSKKPHLDMSQRSAVARVKLEKVVASSTPESSRQAPGKRSNPFNSLFSSNTPTANSALSSNHGYSPLHLNKASVSALETSPEISNRAWVANTSPRGGSKAHEKKLVVVSSSVPEELWRLKDAHAALLAENIQLRAALGAERKFSERLCCFLQRHHESEGRLNPDPGNLRSAYYRELKDENNNSLVSPEIIQLLGDAEGGCWGVGVEVDNEEEFVAESKAITKSFN